MYLFVGENDARRHKKSPALKSGGRAISVDKHYYLSCFDSYDCISKSRFINIFLKIYATLYYNDYLLSNYAAPK